MAIISLTYDTKEKKLDANMDGKVIEDLYQVSIYKYDDEARIELTKMSMDKNESMSTRTCIYASEHEIKEVKDDTIMLSSLSDKLKKQLRVI